MPRGINGEYYNYIQPKGSNYYTHPFLLIYNYVMHSADDKNPYLNTGIAPTVGFKMRTPKVYSRAKSLRLSFKAESPEPYTPIRSPSYGLLPSHIYVENGKVISSKIDPENRDWYGQFTRDNARQAVKVLQNYENAMHRRRTYTYKGLKRNLFNDGLIGVKSPDDNSLLIEATARSVPNNQTIFHPTHFAPESLRKGYNLIKEMANSSLPTMFTVTKDLSPMLEKQGFIKVKEIPQIFNGELVTKDVLLNRSTTKESLLNKINEINSIYSNETLPFNESDLDKYIDIINKQLYPLNPKLNVFPINQLIKQTKYAKSK